MDNMSLADDIRWEYEHACKLHEFYWGVALKCAAYFYTLAGTLGSFFIVNRSVPNLAWTLLIPIYLGLMLSVIYFIGCVGVDMAQEWFEVLATSPAMSMQYHLKNLPLGTIFIG